MGRDWRVHRRPRRPTFHWAPVSYSMEHSGDSPQNRHFWKACISVLYLPSLCVHWLLEPHLLMKKPLQDGFAVKRAVTHRTKQENGSCVLIYFHLLSSVYKLNLKLAHVEKFGIVEVSCFPDLLAVDNILPIKLERYLTWGEPPEPQVETPLVGRVLLRVFGDTDLVPSFLLQTVLRFSNHKSVLPSVVRES